MRFNTEEVEILKVELKDIKEILKLKEEIKGRGLDEPHNENSWATKTKVNQSRTSSINGQDQRFKCEKCSFECQNRIVNTILRNILIMGSLTAMNVTFKLQRMFS